MSPMTASARRALAGLASLIRLVDFGMRYLLITVLLAHDMRAWYQPPAGASCRRPGPFARSRRSRSPPRSHAPAAAAREGAAGRGAARQPPHQWAVQVRQDQGARPAQEAHHKDGTRQQYAVVRGRLIEELHRIGRGECEAEIGKYLHDLSQSPGQRLATILPARPGKKGGHREDCQPECPPGRPELVTNDPQVERS